MLPAEHRLRSSTDFSDVVRRGRRASRSLLTVHLLAPADNAANAARPPRAGLVVSKAVGNSVVRHRTARRLRALLVGRLPALLPGTRLVVRAAPAAGSAASSELGRDLDSALAKAGARVAAAAGPRQ